MAVISQLRKQLLFWAKRNGRLMHNYPTVSAMTQPVSFVIGEDGGKADDHRDAIKSLRLMQDCGLICRAGNGLFHLMPIMLRVLQKLTAVVDSTFSSIGAHKIQMPTLVAESLLKRSGRWDAVGSELFTLEDRHGKRYCLAPTHEEAITRLVASMGRVSYRQLPLSIYQITSKFRDEMNPRLGLLRGREFLMKDLYTFDATEDNARKTYERVCEAYDNIFARLGLSTVRVVGSSGIMGGSFSHEYHLLSDVGEDKIFQCSECAFGANAEVMAGCTTCPECKAPLQEKNGIEVGHTFLLGTKYSRAFNAQYWTEQLKPNFMEMGCFGIGMTRLIAAAVEVLSLPDEIRWPRTIAPYTVCIIPPKKGSNEEPVIPLVSHLHEHLSNCASCRDDVIIDDRRHMTIGRRLNDARRMGFLFVLILGKQAMETVPKIELHNVATKTSSFLTTEEIFQFFNHQST